MKRGNESHTAASQAGCLVFSLRLLSEPMNPLSEVETMRDGGDESSAEAPLHIPNGVEVEVSAAYVSVWIETGLLF